MGTEVGCCVGSAVGDGVGGVGVGAQDAGAIVGAAVGYGVGGIGVGGLVCAVDGWASGQRVTQSWTQIWYTIAGLLGQRCMHGANAPPGQPDVAAGDGGGVGGVGGGVGSHLVGEGVGGVG